MDPNLDNLLSDDARFDRLVDGELSERERRELLSALDSEPGGWRRCALAFLESQCWKESAGQVANLPLQSRIPGSSSHEPIAGSAKPRGRHSRWAHRLGVVAAMAASFLAALFIVSAVQRFRSGGPNIPAGPIGVDVAANRPQPVQQEYASGSPWQMVTLAAPAGAQGQEQRIRVPAVERDQLDSEWFRSQPPAIPDDVLRAFARTGHQVEQRRQFVPVPLQDGRRLVVPVDQVEVHYTGGSAY